MVYQALYRKWRPRTFDSVVGQTAITNTLKNAILRHTVSHAFLFAGPRGTGKTSCAKIFAKALNCTNLQDGEPCNECANCLAADQGSMPDIMEIDAASNNGVDEIRNIRDKVKYAPTQGKYKVYIIDEVHMLSIGAFNALLKTLEEPPEHVVFILATTELQKVPATIISRTQRYNFKRISAKDLIDRMKYILNEEKIAYEEPALEVIAQVADGGMRDALSILDQLLSYETNQVSYQDALEITGFADQEKVEAILAALLAQDSGQALTQAEAVLADGASPKNILDEIIDLATQALLAVKTKKATSHFVTENFAATLAKAPADRFFQIIDQANAALNDLRYTNQQKIPLEVFLVKASQAAPTTETSQAAPSKQPELQQLQKQLSELTRTVEQLVAQPASKLGNGINLIDDPRPKTPQKATAEPISAAPVRKRKKKPKRDDKKLKEQVYHVLENATKADRAKILDVWDDLKSKFKVSDQAFLNILHPITASSSEVLLSCEYEYWFEEASGNANLLAQVEQELGIFTKQNYKIVVVPKSKWLELRDAFIKGHRSELMQKKQSQAAIPEGEQAKQATDKQQEQEVIDKAKEMFGDAVNIKDE